MRPTSILILTAAAVLAGACGLLLGTLLTSYGQPLPLPGWLPGVMLLLLTAGLLYWGLMLRRYLEESEERAEKQITAPRRYDLDMTTAFRIVILARAASWTGSLVAGFFGGELLFLILNGSGTLIGAIAPTAFSTLTALALCVAGVVVERWGMLPPPGGDEEAAQAEASG